MEEQIQQSQNSKKEYLSLLISWAQDMGCTQDHKLISNCLDFRDSKSQVSTN